MNQEIAAGYRRLMEQQRKRCARDRQLQTCMAKQSHPSKREEGRVDLGPIDTNALRQTAAELDKLKPPVSALAVNREFAAGLRALADASTLSALYTAMDDTEQAVAGLKHKGYDLDSFANSAPSRRTAADAPGAATVFVNAKP